MRHVGANIAQYTQQIAGCKRLSIYKVMRTGSPPLVYVLVLTPLLALHLAIGSPLQAQSVQPNAGTAPQAAPTTPQSVAASKLSPANATQYAAEEKIGKEASADIAKTSKFVTDPAIVNRVTMIGAKIAAIADTQMVKAGFGTSDVYPFKYTYHVIDDKQINAFSIPGGYIYIYRGLYDLLTSDDELAAVLGHETAHAAHHHVSMLTHQANKMSSDLALGALAAVLAHVPLSDVGNLTTGAYYSQAAILNNHFSEEAEEDADHTGMIYMMKAGFNPVGMLAMLQRLKQVEDASPDVELGFLMDHPLTSQRVATARAELATLGVTVDAHSMREASGLMIAEVVDQGKPGSVATSNVTLDSQVLFQVAGGDRSAAVAAADKINTLLDDNLQMYEVKSDGAVLMARNQPVIEFTPADQAALPPSAAQSSPTPDAMAASAAKTIRNVLWSQAVLNTPDQEIDVGAGTDVQPYR
jgi:beta-barrel assembly-enhancing protease